MSTFPENRSGESHYKKNWARYGPIWTVFMEITGYSCPNLMKLEIFATDFRRKSSNVKFRENSPVRVIIRRTERDMVQYVRSSWKVQVILARIWWNLKFSRQIFGEKVQMLNFAKICSVRVILGRTERDMVQYGRSSWKLQVILARIW